VLDADVAGVASEQEHLGFDPLQIVRCDVGVSKPQVT